MSFRFGFNQPGGRGGAPRPPGFGNFRMQFRGQNPGAPQRPTAPGSQSIEDKHDDLALLFVSNISEKCPNDLVKDMLDVFGKVEKWTRIQDSDGNFPPFGFCGYKETSSAVQALLVLNNFYVGDKRLNVKADEKAKQKLVDFVVSDRIAKLLPRKPLGHELEPLEDDYEHIKEFREKLRTMLRERNPSLVSDDADDDLALKNGKEKSHSPSPAGKKSSKHADKKKHRSKKRSRSPPRSHSKSKRSRSRSKHSRSRSARSPSSRSTRSRSSAKATKRKRKTASPSGSSTSSAPSVDRKRRSKRSPSFEHNGLDSDDSDVVRERKERKREKSVKDQEYLRRLKKVEERERRMAKQYAREDEADQTRTKALQKEAKKLAQFLEDYDDDRDDPKYYKSSSYHQRKRDYDMEREADAKDRQDEAREMEKLRAEILASNKNTINSSDSGRKRKEGSKSRRTESPHVPLDKENKTKKNGEEDDQAFRYSFVEEKAVATLTTPASESTEWTPGYEKPSTSIDNTDSPVAKGSGKVITTFQNKVLSVNAAFVEEDEDEDSKLHVIKKKIKPFEITAQDRIESMTAEEKKQMVKELIEAIPTNKEPLFEYEVKWEQLDDVLMEERIKPWIERKIREYIGDDEPSLVSFIVERVNKQDPKNLLVDLAMILDDEAESFVVKLWRLIIFQTEAKKVGLNISSTKT